MAGVVGEAGEIWALVSWAAAFLLAGVAAGLLIRMWRLPFRPAVAFWWTLNELYCRLWFRLKREGPCTVPAEGPVVIVANHTCAIDPLLLVASVPRRVPAFVVAKEYHDLPLAGRLTRMIECIPVRRDGQDTAATRAALRHLKAGKALGIFIEGRIARPGETLEAKDGATMLALHARALIVPAQISGTRWDENVLRSFFRRHRARVRFGPPMDLAALAGPRPDKDTVGRLSAMLLEQIRELGREAGPRDSAPLDDGGKAKRVPLASNPRAVSDVSE